MFWPVSVPRYVYVRKNKRAFSTFLSLRGKKVMIYGLLGRLRTSRSFGETFGHTSCPTWIDSDRVIFDSGFARPSSKIGMNAWAHERKGRRIMIGMCSVARRAFVSLELVKRSVQYAKWQWEWLPISALHFKRLYFQSDITNMFLNCMIMF